MYINISSGFIVEEKEIIGVFDIDNTTVSKRGRSFLPNAEQKGAITYTTDDLPQSFVLTQTEQKDELFVTSISPRTLFKRINGAKTI